ncbi:MAG: TIR domain-containing protein [Blastocatellia bacterium]
MAKRVFFSFHYQDVADFRVNVVRNHWVTKESREGAGFFDASIWEDAKKTGELALKRLINKALENTSVTCVLIGSDTYTRPWVQYELIKSIEKNNSIFGIHINQIKDKDGQTKASGPNPLDFIALKFNTTGNKAEVLEFRNSRWQEFQLLPSISFSKIISNLSGKTCKLSDLFVVYDWIAEKGYINFSKWVEVSSPL